MNDDSAQYALRGWRVFVKKHKQSQTEKTAKSIATIWAALIPNPSPCANTLQWFTDTASKKQVPLCYYAEKC